MNGQIRSGVGSYEVDYGGLNDVLRSVSQGYV